MKKIFYLLIILMTTVSLAKAQDTNKYYPKIQKVTVFETQAQIEKTIEVPLKKGNNEIILAGNSYMLNPQSINFNSSSQYSIMDFSPYVQYVEADKAAEEKLSDVNRKRVKVLKDSIELINYKIVEVNNLIKVLYKEKSSLENMKVVTYSYNIDTVAKMKDGLNYFRDKMTEVNALIQKKEKEVITLAKNRDDINVKLRIILQDNIKKEEKGKNEYYILVNVYSAKDMPKAKLEYKYLVNAVAWFPVYDINFTSGKDDVEFVLKSSLQQRTGEDWTDVKIVFSTEQPNDKGEVSELKPTYYSMYSSSQYTQGSSVLTGTISDASTGDIMPFVNVTVDQGGVKKGSATTDMNGNFQIRNLSSGYYNIVANSVGYNKGTRSGVRVNESGYSPNGSIALVPSNGMNLDVLESGKRLSSEYIDKMTANTVDGIIASVGGVSDYDYSSARGESGMVTYINGVAKKGSVSMPKQAIAEVQVQLGGTSARYGDYSRNIEKMDYSDIAREASYSVSSKNITNEYRLDNASFARDERMLGKEYVVSSNYTINSGDKPKTIPLESSLAKTFYKHFTVPKVERIVYLSAMIPEWEELQLMSANGKIYVDNNFLRDTYIDSYSTEDTLQLPIGREKRIAVDRKVAKSAPEKANLRGSTSETIVTITLTVKNNTQSKADIKLDDQIPLSSTESIKITSIDTAKAEYDEKTGKLVWNLTLNALESKTITFSYLVKHPKGANLPFN